MYRGFIQNILILLKKNVNNKSLLTKLNSMTLSNHRVSARLSMTITVSPSTKKYKHLFLQPYTPILSPLHPVFETWQSSLLPILVGVVVWLGSSIVVVVVVWRELPLGILLEFPASSDQFDWPLDNLRTKEYHHFIRTLYAYKIQYNIWRDREIVLALYCSTVRAGIIPSVNSIPAGDK